MPSQTTRYRLPYSTAADTLDSIDNTMQALADRLDLVMGETGEVTITPPANGAATQVVAFERDYGALFGQLELVVQMQLVGAPATHTWSTPYVTGVTGTGFTAGTKANVTGNYVYRWSVRAMDAKS